MRSLLYNSQDQAPLNDFVDCIEDQESLRNQIQDAGLCSDDRPSLAIFTEDVYSGLVAFVADGAVLPRASGASDSRLTGSQVVEFRSPTNLARSFTLPHRGIIQGMGIPAGITMIAGGGFHGKSTLLDALSVGCYNHVPGGYSISLSYPLIYLIPYGLNRWSRVRDY